MGKFATAQLGSAVVLAAALSSSACTFDTSTTSAAVDSGFPEIDGDVIDPEDCPADIHINFAVNDIATPPAPGSPYLDTLIGDTVKLSAAGSCTRSGTISYSWRVEPGTSLAESSALPGLSSRELTVYSQQAEQYTVRLEIGDGTGAVARQSFFAFQSHGFAPLAQLPGAEVQDLSAGADYLWIATDDGAFRAPLADPAPGPYASVNDVSDGDSIPADVAAVLESGGYAWFGAGETDGKVYRFHLGSGEVSGIETIDGARTTDLSPASTGVRVATDRGIALSTDLESFESERDDAAEAVTFGATGAWAGKDKLYPLPGSASIDVTGGNNKIISLVDDGARLWIGTEDKGVFTVKNGSVETNYTTANSELSHSRATALAVDSQGDVWAATSEGVSRFKQDRQIWVPITGKSGLGSALNLGSIAVDESKGRRAIYVGGQIGIAVMHIR